MSGAEDFRRYRQHYSEAGFRQKLSGLGRGVALQAILLYALLTDGNTPVWAKGLIVGVLGYLVLPFDAIPDFIPVIGYVDDAAAMGLLLHQLRDHVTPEVRQRTESILPARFRNDATTTNKETTL